MQFIDLATQQARIRQRIDERIAAVLEHGEYINGPEVASFETALSEFCGVDHVMGCANGTDALQLALMALGVGKGDAVFVPSFTFAATAEMAPFVGATPFFVDIDPVTYNLDVQSLKRSILSARDLGLVARCVIPVDLFGLPADYDSIQDVATAEGLFVIEDCAQGLGARYHGKSCGWFGDIATTSFFPAKPLGCYGDGGAVFTKSSELAECIHSLRVHGKGHDKYDNIRIGMNSRLDTLQAAILLEKLTIFSDEINARNRIASRYDAALESVITTPSVPDGLISVWAQYTLRARGGSQRDALVQALRDKGIPSVVYYPKPLHTQTAYAQFPRDPMGLPQSESASSEVLSLPMSAYLREDDQNKIISTLYEACKCS